MKYRNYTIKPTDPQPPIPDRRHDWCYVHDDYDGPGDHRCGTAASAEDCRRAVDEIYLDEAEGL